ncbi:MAG TPA: glycosyltransferase family 87 protein [Terracidiphilus sp.]|nr:glycosyltransferase family 87 protein [Terracidiphilus sp.]
MAPLQKKRPIWAVVHLSCLLVACAVFIVSARNAVRFPGIDLRAKVVGARLLLAHQNPYPSPEHPDPNEFFRMFNYDTYTPFLLSLYAPLSHLPYTFQRLVYFFIDWICIAFLFFRTRLWLPPAHRKWHGVLFTLLVIIDFGVLIHMERGQYYLAIAAAIAWAIGAWKDGRADGWSGAIALGMLILVRPTFAIVLPVLWLLKCRTPMWRTAVVFFVLLALTVTIFGPRPWQTYVRSVYTQQSAALNQIFTRNNSADTAPKESRTKIAEGIDFSSSLDTNYTISRVFLGNLGQNRIKTYAARIFRTPQLLSLVNRTLLILAALYCLLLAHRLNDAPHMVKLGFAFLAPIVIETFGPQRNAYCDIYLVPVLFAMLGFLFEKGRLSGWMRLGAAGGVGVCILAAAGAWILSPSGIAIEAVSLARWYVLLVLVNLYVVGLALHPKISSETPLPHL